MQGRCEGDGDHLLRLVQHQVAAAHALGEPRALAEGRVRVGREDGVRGEVDYVTVASAVSAVAVLDLVAYRRALGLAPSVDQGRERGAPALDLAPPILEDGRGRDDEVRAALALFEEQREQRDGLQMARAHAAGSVSVYRSGSYMALGCRVRACAREDMRAGQMARRSHANGRWHGMAHEQHSCK